MISVEEALLLIETTKRKRERVSVPLGEALGRRLATPFLAQFDAPPFTNSAMDGYAVGSLEGPWTMVGTSRAGEDAVRISSTEAARIFTGAAMPKHTFAVVPQEDVTETAGLISTIRPPNHMAHIRFQAEEFPKGTTLFEVGTLLTPPVVSSIAAQGVDVVDVLDFPRVAVLSTGSELQQPGRPLRSGAIYDSNGSGLEAVLSGLGCRVTKESTVDNESDVRDTCRRLLESSDVLVTVGGVSVGDYDFVAGCMKDLGFHTFVSGVAMKPGKPFKYGSRSDGKWWFGLPGNPMSAMVTCCLFLLAFLGEGTSSGTGTICHSYARQSGREEFVLAHLAHGRVTLLPTIGSHSVTGLAAADVLVQIPSGTLELDEGSAVSFLRLPWWRER